MNRLKRKACTHYAIRSRYAVKNTFVTFITILLVHAIIYIMMDDFRRESLIYEYNLYATFESPIPASELILNTISDYFVI
jgi:hypothetical protein